MRLAPSLTLNLLFLPDVDAGFAASTSLPYVEWSALLNRTHASLAEFSKAKRTISSLMVLRLAVPLDGTGTARMALVSLRRTGPVSPPPCPGQASRFYPPRPCRCSRSRSEICSCQRPPCCPLARACPLWIYWPHKPDTMKRKANRSHCAIPAEQLRLPQTDPSSFVHHRACCHGKVHLVLQVHLECHKALKQFLPQ